MHRYSGRQKGMTISVIAIVLLSLLSGSLPFSLNYRTVSAADSVFYDFLAQAPSASWSSGAGSLSFPGSDSDSQGFALYRDNWQLEDNSTWTRALETHPQWVSNGWIMGKYPQMIVPSNAELKVTVGFFKGASGSDGVTFEVRFEEFFGLQVAPKTYSILSYVATYDGKLDSIVEDLSSFEGKTGSFILYVSAGQSSGQDWAAWAEAKIEIAAPPELPDLIVSAIECGTGNKLSVTIKNIGSGALPTGWAAVAKAYFDDEEKGFFDLTSPTSTSGGGIEEPGGSSTYLIAWDITVPVTVRVMADSTNEITESNEQNNSLSESCECVDATPPQIISGPVVSQITQTSAIICWETDEESDSLVRYDKSAGQYASVMEDPNLVKEHCLNLTNLEPEVIYHFIVESKDSSGNEVRSQDLNFETSSQPDKENPLLSLLIPYTLSGKATIHASAQDNVGVDRVMFFLDGELVFTDFSAPFDWECDTSILDEGSHSFGAQAFDAAGNVDESVIAGNIRNRFAADLSPVRVRIISPASRSEVYGEVGILAEISHDNNLRISHIEFIVDEAIISEDDFDPPIALIPILTPTYLVSCPWDTSGVELGDHNIRVRVQDEAENWGDAGIVVEVVEPTMPSISVTRDVQRIDNYFEVTLTLRNDSDVDVSSLTISDTSTGFQCIGNALIRNVEWGDFAVIEGTVVNDKSDYWNSTLQTSLGTLLPGRTKVLRYYVVPILTVASLSVSPRIGSNLSISFQAGDREYTQRISSSWSDSASRSSALHAADYLIVTSPAALFRDNPEADVNELLSTMAELAKEKLGVLGYLPERTDFATFNSLIDATGSGGDRRWFPKLCDDWLSNGYLLIVGEDEIVPAPDVTFLGPIQEDGSRVTITVRLSDNPYADSCAGDGIPDLSVGRIIGNTAAELIIPIRTSLDVFRGTKTFDGRDVLLVSGPEGISDIGAFVSHINGMEEIFRSQMKTVEKIHCEYDDTEVGLLREALVLLGTCWDLGTDPDKPDLPDELNDLSHLVGDYTCTGLAGHETEDNPPQICTKSHPPTEIEDLHALISKSQAERVEAAARGISGSYDTEFSTACEAMVARGIRIKEESVDKDIICWAGHGNAGSWACCLDAYEAGDCGSTDLFIDFPGNSLSFGNSAPVVYGASCLTGNYEEDDLEGIAEAFLKRGAAVYIGATESNWISTCCFWQRRFFGVEGSYLPGIPIGFAFKCMKRNLIAMDETDPAQYDFEEWLRISHVYNLYGDPKFGATR